MNGKPLTTIQSKITVQHRKYIKQTKEGTKLINSDDNDNDINKIIMVLTSRCGGSRLSGGSWSSQGTFGPRS